MPMHRIALACAATIAAALALTLASAGGADAQTKVTIGKVIGGDGFHVPTYVALDEGFFKAEGLDASLVELQASAQVTAVLSGNLDCAPIPSGGAQAALSGAKIEIHRRRVAQIAVDYHHAAGHRQAGRSQGQDAGVRAARRRRLRTRCRRCCTAFFHMDSGKDYKVISFQRRGRAHRRHGQQRHPRRRALGSARRRGRAKRSQGVVAHRRYIPRAGGTIWCMQSFVEQHPDTVKKIDRAIAKGGDVFPHQQGRLNQGAGAPYRQHQERRPSRRIWDQLHDSYGAEVPKDLFADILESRRQT